MIYCTWFNGYSRTLEDDLGAEYPSGPEPGEIVDRRRCWLHAVIAARQAFGDAETADVAETED